jgi:hypothetical protein
MQAESRCSARRSGYADIIPSPSPLSVASSVFAHYAHISAAADFPPDAMPPLMRDTAATMRSPSVAHAAMMLPTPSPRYAHSICFFDARIIDIIFALQSSFFFILFTTPPDDYCRASTLLFLFRF